MRKILVGMIVVIIAVASAGYYGALLWTQHQLTLEVDAAFKALRANVGLATHGKIEIDLKRRQITISDIVLQSDRAATATIKIGEIIVAGIIQPSPERIATDRIDITDLELVVSSSSPSNPQMIHRAPKITILGYSGPAALPRTLEKSSIADALQLSLEYFAATTAASISIPTLAVTVASLPSVATELGVSGPIDYTSTDITLHDIRDGRVGAMSLGHFVATGNLAAPDLGKFTGEIGGFSAIDFDANVFLAMLNPAKVKDDGYLRIYRRVSFGPYAVRFDKGTNVQMDSLTIDDVSLRPSKLSVAEFLSLADAGAPSNGPTSPTQLRAMLDKIAGFYEGIRIGKIELRGISANMPPEFAFKLAAISISGLENGRLAEFALEGLDSQTPQKEPLNVGRFALKGLDIATDRIDITDLELVVSSSSPSNPQIIHRAPKITILGFSGPMAPPPTLDNPSIADALQLSLKYFAATAVASISIPTLAVTVASLPSVATESGVSGPIDYTSTDIELHDIRDGRVGAMSLGHFVATGNVAAPDLGKFTGEIGGFSAIDFDANVFLALLNPAKVKDDGYLRLYRRVTFGPYTVRFDKGANVQMDSLTIDDVSLRPSKLSVAEFLPLADAGAPSSGSISPTQLRAMLDKIAGFCEGIRIGKIELRGISANMPPEFAFKLTAISISGLENGRLAEFALEGLDSQTPQKEPLNVGRFALKGLNLANLVRMSAHLGDIGQRPKPEQFLGLLTHIEGIELNDIMLNDIITSHGDKKQTTRIDHFRLSWGHFVGLIPSTARITAKVSLPTSLAAALLTYWAADQDAFQILADTELKVAAVNLDFGVSWTETTRTFAIAPALIELDDMFSASAKLSIHNVRRNIFTVDPDKIMSAVELLEAGPVEFSLRDTGGLHLAIAQFAKSQGQSPEEARSLLVDDINEVADLLAFTNPEAVPVAQAIARFIATPKSTLTVKISPIEQVNLMQAFETAGADPPAVLSQFKIEAKATR